MEGLDWAAMFMLGILGTGHCLGMCGPLVFAFPGRTGRFLPHAWYHLGRIATYVTVGAILGGAGEILIRLTGLKAGADLGQVATALRLLAAALLALLGLIRLGVMREPGWLERLNPERIPGFRRRVAAAGGGGSGRSFFLIGAMLGFLPCGLSYGAFAAALSSGSTGGGALLVLAFAAGTAPGLLLLGTGISALVRRFRRQSDILAGILMLVMAVQLLHRGFQGS